MRAKPALHLTHDTVRTIQQNADRMKRSAKPIQGIVSPTVAAWPPVHRSQGLAGYRVHFSGLRQDRNSEPGLAPLASLPSSLPSLLKTDPREVRDPPKSSPQSFQ
jgi:hypothetical protein